MTTATGAVAIDGRWTGYDGFYGGYVVGLLVDAALASSAFRLASVSVNFVSRLAVEDVEIGVERLHRGRSSELLRLTLDQGGRTRVHGTAELVAADDTGAPLWVRSAGETAPPGTGAGLGRRRLPFDDMVEMRTTAAPRLDPVASSWVRLRPEAGEPGMATDEALVAALLDMPTPGLFGLPEPAAFVPTLDYTVHFAPPVPGAARDWVRLDHGSSWVTRDHCVDDVTAFAADGRILATLRQTRSVRWPDPTDTTDPGGEP
ncbi:MAG: thioesterase family protein [Acidimicrobiales bacterium]|nr:thioesterase family protein [Acidimicrobiales bacterium]